MVAHADVALICELDEQWAFVGSKARQHWLWYAYNTKTGGVLAYTFGPRNDETCRELLALLTPFNIGMITSDDWGSYAREVPKDIHLTGKLDPFKAYILERVQAARPHWIPASVLLLEIREQGYTGGYSMLTAFLLPLKQQPTEPVVRFETPPGEQMQVDFTIIRQGRHPLLAFVATLGWSRATYVRFYARQDTAAWCDGIEHALAFFGGTPRHLLFDNAKAIILERDVYGDGHHRWNPLLLALAEEYGFSPRVCRPYRAKTKGKVERFNRYLKESFVVPLATTFKQSGLMLDVDSANARVGAWLVRTANARKHGTTGVPPDHRLQKELAALLPLPVLRPTSTPRLAEPQRRAVPVESIQHPLSVYQSLLEARL